MKVLLFGATGMVGQGVLRECLDDPSVARVRCVGRTATGLQHPKLDELALADFLDYSTIEQELRGFDACFYCLGVSSGGLGEAQYHRLTYDYTLAAASTLARLNPQMCFIYVSGMGTDSSERGVVMWARVKGKTENALMRLPLKAYMFRPGMIRPLHGIRSKTPAYRWMYRLFSPLWPLLEGRFPRWLTTTEQIGRAMIRVAREGAPHPLLESVDINAL